MDGVCRHQTAVLTIKFSFSETMKKSHHVSALGGLEQPRPEATPRGHAPATTPPKPPEATPPAATPLQPRPRRGKRGGLTLPCAQVEQPAYQGYRVWGENGPASRGLSRSPPWGRPAGEPAAGSRLTVTPGLPAQQPGAPPPPWALSGGRGAPRPASPPHRGPRPCRWFLPTSA